MFVCTLFNDPFSETHTASNERMIGEWRVGKYVEGSGILAFSWRDCGTPRKTSVTIAGLRAET
jgi:hypothetical protein